MSKTTKGQDQSVTDLEVNKEAEIPSMQDTIKAEAIEKASQWVSVHGDKTQSAFDDIKSVMIEAYEQYGEIKKDYDLFHNTFSDNLGKLQSIASIFVHGNMASLSKWEEAIAILDEKGIAHDGMPKVTPSQMTRNGALLLEVANSDLAADIVAESNANGDSTKNTLNKIAKAHGVEVRATQTKPESARKKAEKAILKEFGKLTDADTKAILRVLVKKYPNIIKMVG
tara:strand:+ start:5964 stop:6641 length:678 start_codon:yes stop_codon:yes gene_type:complete